MSASSSSSSSDKMVSPSAGNVKLKIIVDGRYLAPTSEQNREIVRTWTNLHRTQVHKSIPWKNGTRHTLSEPIEMKMHLNDEYDELEKRKKRGEGASVGRFKVNGKLRRDAMIWFEVMAEEKGVGNVAVMCSAGTGSVTVKDLMEASESGNAVAVPLFLHSYFDQTTRKPMLKGAISVMAVFEDPNATSTFVHSKAPKTRFELTQENAGVMSAIMQSEIMGQITPFMESAKKAGVNFRETMEPNSRIISPWRMSGAGQLWAPSYFANSHSGGLLVSEAPEDEKAYLDLIHYAMHRDNWNPDEAFEILDKQLARTDATYDDRVTGIVACLGTAFMLFPTSLPYKSDTRDLHTRESMMKQMVPAAASQLESSSGEVNVESYDDAMLRGGDDCEGSGLAGKLIADAIANGEWSHPHLKSAKRLMKMGYVHVSNLGSVTSPKMEQDHHTSSRLDTSHDVDKIGQHLEYSENHHRQIEIFKAAGEPTGKEPELKHHYAKIYPPPKENLGGHSWAQFVPVWSFAEQVRRVVPDVDVRAVFGASAEPGSDPVEAPAWLHYLPEMVGEGTASVFPLLKPIVEYTVNGDRDAVRLRELNYQRSLHAIVSKSTTFRSMKTQMRQFKTVHTPNTRHTGFYRQTTQVFADKFMDTTGGVASYNAVRTHSVDENALNDDHDPLRNIAYSSLASSAVHKLAIQMDTKLQRAALRVGSNLPEKGTEHMRGAFVHVSGENNKYDGEKLSSEMEEAMILGDLAGMKTLATNKKRDACNLVDPEMLSLGVDMEERLEWPLCNRIALVPNKPLSKVGAYAMQTYQRHLPPMIRFSKKLPFLATEASRKVAVARMGDDGSVTSENTARLVENEEVVEAQRSYVRSISTRTRSLFSNRDWLSRDEAQEKGLSLVTFSFKPYDLVSEKVGDHIMQDLSNMKRNGLVYSADFYIEEPTQHIQNAVFRLLCKAPKPEK